MVFLTVARPHAHANIFLKPFQQKQLDEKSKTDNQQKQRSNSFIGRLFNKDKSEMTARDTLTKRKTTTKTVKQQQLAKYKPQKSRPFSKEAFAIYKQAQRIDPILLGFSGREPSTAEEITQVAAYHNTTKVVAMLENRRKNREAFFRAKEARAKIRTRNQLLIQNARARTNTLNASQGTKTSRTETSTPRATRSNTSKPRVSRGLPGITAKSVSSDNGESKVFTDF